MRSCEKAHLARPLVGPSAHDDGVDEPEKEDVEQHLCCMRPTQYYDMMMVSMRQKKRMLSSTCMRPTQYYGMAFRGGYYI